MIHFHFQNYINNTKPLNLMILSKTEYKSLTVHMTPTLHQHKLRSV